MPKMPDPVYAPEILPSLEAICARFQVGEKKVKAWLKRGAPIALEGQGSLSRYSCECLRLQIWREAQNSKNASPCA